MIRIEGLNGGDFIREYGTLNTVMEKLYRCIKMHDNVITSNDLCCSSQQNKTYCILPRRHEVALNYDE
jgi:hypothetical protein